MRYHCRRKGPVRGLIIALIYALCGAAAPAAADVFADPALAEQAQRYARQLAAAGAALDDGDVELRAAEKAIEQQRWRDAVELYQRALALRPQSGALWLWLSRAWSGDDADDAPPLSLARAAQAAYLGYLAAADAGGRGYALRRLGELYQLQKRPHQAIAAYRASLAVSADDRLAERLRQLVDAHAFRATGVEVDADSATPSVCIVFSEKLKKDRRIDYRDYLRLTPAPAELSAAARGERLCVQGVAHGERYQVLVREGLSAVSGRATQTAERFDAEVGDRKPSLGFRGSAYLLPRRGDRGVPLTSVNVDAVALTLLRIGDRSLIEQINRERLGGALSGYDIDQVIDRSGERIWSGTMTLDARRNQTLTSALPTEPMLADPRPGIYILVAEDQNRPARRYAARATQWLVVSDIGLFTLRGDDGLHVFARSLASAEPLAGVELALFARNNDRLGGGVSDRRGYLRFDPGLLRGAGGRAAAALTARRDDAAGAASAVDFNFLDLTRPAFDLSDRGVAGRPAPGPVDAFLYSDRGVYRPGETVRLITLLRDAAGRALSGLPLTLRIVRPDAVEVERRVLDDDRGGGYHADLELADNARGGRWRVRAYLDADATAEPVGELAFQVEDFVPQQLGLELSGDAERLLPGENVTVTMSGRFLYGAPAAGLKTDAELILRRRADPYPEFPGYRFGLAQEDWTAQRFSLTPTATDADGASEIGVSVAQTPDTTLPLEAVVRASLFEPGGRPVTRSLALPFQPQPFMIGIRPRFDGELAPGQRAEFALIAVGRDGARRAAAGLRYELLREDYDYVWYYQNSRWNYRLVINDGDRVAAGGVAIDAASAATISRDGLDWGSYRLDVYDPNGDATVASSVRFQVGWFARPGAGDAPDQLRVTLDKTSYADGDLATLRVDGGFSGEALLSVLGERLLLSRTFSLDQRGGEVSFPVAGDWGAGAYVTVTAFRPGERGDRGPGRAIGLSWLALDPQPRRLALEIDAPAELRPRQTVTLPLRVDNRAPNETVWVTLAAVDEGILQLTDFATPDPVHHYFGKRRLGVELRDVYGRLIAPVAGARAGRLRSGGDEAGRNLSGSGVRTVETVALFSGPVEVGESGVAEIELPLPDFNGELRLMATAWSGDRLGHAERALTVRDPLIASVYLPRFLAVGDVAELAVELKDLGAEPGRYRARLHAAGAVALDAPTTLTLTVGDGAGAAAASGRYPLRAASSGVGELTLDVSGPNRFALSRRWRIGVRAAQPVVRRSDARRLAPGESLRLDDELLSRYRAGSGALRASVAARPALNVPGLLAALDRYPYGCLEQTTSRALPLLYFNELSAVWGAGGRDTALRDRVQRALQRLLTLQQPAGGFGLWSSDSPAELWLSAYALEFMTRAGEQRYLLPTAPYRRGLDWLERRLAAEDYQPAALPARAYALYVLTRAGRARGGDLRYLHDRFLERIPTPLAQAQLGAALAAFGDRDRAAVAFAAALRQSGAERADARDDYGSPLRDRAALLALAAEAGFLDRQIPRLTEELAREVSRRRYTSTQEQAWLLLAAHALGGGGELRLAIDGAPRAPGVGPLQLEPDAAALAAGVVVENRGDQPVWATLDASGVPAAALPAERAGLRIQRRLFRRDGAPFDAASVGQNETLLVLLSGRADAARHHQTLIVDLLPAGMEIENLRLVGDDALEQFAWLPPLSTPRHVEFRDDRFVAAVDLTPEEPDFAVAYLVRAVTPGEYRQPAPFIEDMYQPWFFARGELGRLTVSR